MDKRAYIFILLLSLGLYFGINPNYKELLNDYQDTPQDHVLIQGIAGTLNRITTSWPSVEIRRNKYFDKNEVVYYIAEFKKVIHS